MVSTVEGGEQGAGQVFELLVRVVHKLFFSLLKTGKVHEGNRMVVDTNISDQLAHVTGGRVVNILEDTMLQGRMVLLESVVRDVLFNLVTHDMLVTEHVSDLVLIDLHAFLISPLKCLGGVTVVILQVEVLLL